MASITASFLTDSATADMPAVRQTQVARALRYLEDEINRVVHEAARLMEATADVRLGDINIPTGGNECRPPSNVVLADRLDALGERLGGIADLLCEATNRTEL